MIRNLFEALVPSIIMSIGFVLCGGLIVGMTGDPALGMLLVAGALASAIRLFIAWRGRKLVRAEDMDVAQARQIERPFAITYYLFALILGMFGARVFWLAMPSAHMLMICLLLGYAAGVASGISRRPVIAVPSMLMALVPSILIAVMQTDPLYRATALMTAAFLAGGIHSLRQRHARAVSDIGRRLTFAALARRDELTGLSNRLALREWFDQQMATSNADRLIAIHCLDLNGFKPVNDGFGHPVGDKLLAAVGKRIARTIRETDMAARIGGDEFAVVQRGLADPREAEALAHRFVDAIGRPFRIGEHRINVSTSVGYIVLDENEADLEHLIGLADEALYSAKRGGEQVKRHRPADPQPIAA